jgi:uncharacterized protein (DUF2141 family)
MQARLNLMRALFAIGVATWLAMTVDPSPCARTRDSDSAAVEGCTLRIHVDGLRNAKGNIGTVVFKSADGWPEQTNKAFRVGPAPIGPDGHSGTAVWEDLPPGDYGVAAIHDENSNAKLDKNLLGIPKEGFGFANNPHVGWGPPPFSAAIVHVTCPVTEITVHIQYK